MYFDSFQAQARRAGNAEAAYRIMQANPVMMERAGNESSKAMRAAFPTH